ncbi:hypothetical protein J4731_14185 [Providencia rettgeri]|nr:hypothetical protein [Providencia rettgeri]
MINGVTVIGILVGSSVIPVAGLVIGGILLVGAGLIAVFVRFKTSKKLLILTGIVN